MQIKDRQQLLTILAITAVALLALDKIVRPPLMNLWNGNATRIQDLKNQVHDGGVLKHRGEYLRSQWARMQAGTLPNDTTRAEQQLFNGLNSWAQSSGIGINSITPQWKQGSDPDYKTLECRVDATGSIDRLSQFLYDLERDPMALKLQSVELTANDHEGRVLALGVQVSALILTPKEPAK